jgi:hypothetical protein
MSFTAEELLQKMFPIQSNEMISLMQNEKMLSYKFFLLTKEESMLVDVMLAKFDKRLPLLMERYRSLQAEKIQIRKQILQTRVELSNLTKSIKK